MDIFTSVISLFGCILETPEILEKTTLSVTINILKIWIYLQVLFPFFGCIIETLEILEKTALSVTINILKIWIYLQVLFPFLVVL